MAKVSFLSHWQQVVRTWNQVPEHRGWVWFGEPPSEVPPEARPRGQTTSAWQAEDGTWWAVGVLEGHGLALATRGADGPLAAELVRLAVDWARSATLEAQLTDELLLAWDWLNFLFSLAQAVGRAGQPAVLMEQVVRQLHQVLPAQEVFLVIEEPDGQRVFSSAPPGRDGRNAWLHLLSMLEETRPRGLVFFDAEHVPPPLQPHWHPHWRYLAYVVLPLSEPYRGLLGLRDFPEGQLTAAQQNLFLTGAEQVATLLNLTYARWVQERAMRLEHELSIAQMLQRRMLPQWLPTLPGMAFGCWLEPASQVGGDFYDVFVAPNQERVLLMLGDVAGKGVPAAMLTALMHAAFRAEAAHGGAPVEVLARMHRLVFAELEQAEAFITLALLEIDTRTWRYRYASAGHPEMFLLFGDPPQVLYHGATGLPFGVLAEPYYEQREGDLPPGTVVWLYSDGVTEAESPSGRVLGRNGLLDLALAFYPLPPQQQLEGVRQALAQHCGEQALRDDVALLLVQTQSEARPLEAWPFVFPGTTEGAQALAQAVAQRVREWGARYGATAPSTLAATWELATAEVATNVARHAYRTYTGRLQGYLQAWPEGVQLTLWDSGQPFSTGPLPAFDPQAPPEHGYGLRLLHRLMARVSYRRWMERNRWVLQHPWR